MQLLRLPLRTHAVTLALLAICACSSGAAYVVPFDIDPPIEIDANLDDWAAVPNPIALNSAEQVTYDKRAWRGVGDLSGTVHLAHRFDGILLAAEVTDDVVWQPNAGADMWRGDHVMIWLDMTPGDEPERELFGEGQYQIGISPGNFEGEAGGAEAIAPEARVYRPEGVQQTGAVVASRLTDSGYVLEAYIPFSALKLPAVAMNAYAHFEIGISDADNTDTSQEQMITSGTKPWAMSRARLLPVAFGDGNAKAELPGGTVALSDGFVLQRGGSQSVAFNSADIAAGMEPFVSFKGRREFTTPGGYSTQALIVELNGKPLEGARVADGVATAERNNGRSITRFTPDGRLTLPWAADFTSTDEHAEYGLVGLSAAAFEFYLGGLIQEGENTLTFRNVCYQISEEKDILTLGDVALVTKPFSPALGLLKPAPTGDLPVFEPQTAFPMTYELVSTGEGAVRFRVGGEDFEVTSRFSAPGGKWQAGSCAEYSHDRQVIEHDEWIEVRDTFRNISAENVAVMQDHRCTLGERSKGVWLCGSKIPAGMAKRSQSDNPSVYITTDGAGVGMIPLNDVFMIHSRQEANSGTARLSDEELYLTPGETYTAEWAIVPVPDPDSWRFVNQARRVLDTNFTLATAFAFHFGKDEVYSWSDARLKNFVERKSTNFVVKSLYGAGRLENGGTPRGTIWMERPLDAYVDFHKRVHELFPEGNIKTGIYFHCFLDVDPRNDERFADDRVLTAGGNHLTYGEGRSAYMKYFVPTLENGFGREMERWLDTIMVTVGVDGVYWDEFAFTRGRYTYNMEDGCSADIDPGTHEITRIKGSTALLSRDWRFKQVKRILDEGRPFIVNGMPLTRTLRQLKFQAFTETGTIGNCRNTLLYSPVALGDHLSERTFKDAYGVMLKALDYGCLYNWYGSDIVPPEKTLTEYMFPFTPIELHGGHVIGEERILTNHSGLFGWGDDSRFEGHVYDREGIETDRYPVARVERDGKAFAEVRIPGGYSAAVVRRAK